MRIETVLGVDGGKSKTVCLLAEQSGRLLGWGRAGNSDKYEVPTGQALDEVERCVSQAIERAGLTDEVAAGCFGLAGADWPEDFQELETGLIKRQLARVALVKNDMHIALRANAETGAGIVLSAGTHLAAAIRTPQGDEWHSAWFSVEGYGGVQTGHRILWAVLQAYDGRGQPTILTDLILGAKGLTHPLDLLRALSEGKIDDTYKASLVPLLFEAHHEHGDPVAAQILIEAGEDMSRWVTGLLGRFNLLDEPVPVILAGGMFKGKGQLLLDTVTQCVHERAPKTELKMARREPVLGALFYAYELLGIPITPELVGNLETTTPGPELFRTA